MFSDLREEIQSVLDEALIQPNDVQYNYRRELDALIQLQPNKNILSQLIREIIQNNEKRYAIVNVMNFIFNLQNYQAMSASSTSNMNQQLNVLNGSNNRIETGNQKQSRAAIALANSLNNLYKNLIMRAFYKLKSNSIDIVMHKLNCRNKMKGKILMMIYQNHFPADLKKKEFFFRWKVRSNISHTRNIINKLVLNARIQPEIAFWRLRNLIQNPYEGHIIGKKLVQFEIKIKKLDITLQKKNGKLAIQKLYSNMKRSKYIQRMVGEFEKKMNKLMKKLGLKAIKQNRKDYDRLQKFQNGLNNLAKKKISLFLTRLKQAKDLAEEKKKRTALNIFENAQDSHRKMIQLWSKQTNQDKQYKKCKLLMVFMEQLNKQLAINTVQQFQTDRQQTLKKQAIEKMFNNFNQHARNMLKTWRVNAKMGSLNREMLKQMVKNLSSQIKNGDSGKMRQTLHSFYMNMRIVKVQNNFFNGLFETSTGSILTVFRKWQNIPRRNLPSIIFQANLQKFTQKRLRPFYDYLKEISQEGENRKKTAIQNMLNKTQSSTKRLFNDWKQMINTDKMIRKCKMTITLFERLNQTLHSNYSMLFEDNSKQEKMRKAILTMQNNWKANHNRYFYRWRKVNQEYKVSQLLKNQSYTEMIKRMVDYVRSSSGNSTRKALRQFHTNSRIQQVKIKVFNKLLDTSAGKMINLFMRWKNLPYPEPDNLEFKVRSVKFERILHNFAMRPIKKSFQFLLDIKQDAITIQNKAMITLLNKTMSSHKRMFLNWANTTKTLNHQLKCRKTINLFNFMNEHMSNNLNQIIVYNRVMHARIKGITKLIQNFKKYKIIALQKWHSFVKVQQAEEEVEEEVVKRGGLKRLEEHKQDSDYSKLKSALSQFSLFLRQTKLHNQMFKHIHRRAHQNVFSVFQRWRNLPDRTFPLQSNMLESKLSQKADRTVSSFLTILKQLYKEGEAKKRAGVIRIVENQKRLQKDAFQRIAFSVEQKRRLLQVNKLENIFFILHGQIQSTLTPVMQNDSQQELKRKYLMMLIHNQQYNQESAFQRWKQFCKFEQLGNDKKKLFTEMLERFIGNSDRIKSKQALKQFYLHSRISQIKNHFIQKILDTRAGQTISLFNKWRYLPVITNREEKVQRMRFQLMLHNLAQRRIRQFIDPLKEFREIAETRKKRAIIMLLEKTMSNHKRLFLNWRNEVRQHNQFMKCRKIIEFFENMNKIISNQTFSSIVSSRNSALVEKVIQRMQNGRTQMMRNYLVRWNQSVKWDLLNGEKYKQILRRMVDSLKSNMNTQLRQTLSSFQKNKNIAMVQINFFKQLLNTNAGSKITLFNKWKTLPIQNIGPANQFQIILAKFANNRVSSFISLLREEKSEADQRKRVCIQQLISKTTASNKKFFMEWKNMISTDKIIRRCQTTITLFERIQDILIGNTGFVFKSEKDRFLIEKYVNRLISLQSSNGLEALRRWRQQIQIEKLQNDAVKRSMIQKMQDNIKNSDKQKLRSALSQFHKFYRIQKIKVKVFDTLFSTQAGTRLKVFLKWKSLPIQVMPEEKLKSIKFESILNRLIQRPKKLSFNCFTTLFSEAESKKVSFLF